MKQVYRGAFQVMCPGSLYRPLIPADSSRLPLCLLNKPGACGAKIAGPLLNLLPDMIDFSKESLTGSKL